MRVVATLLAPDSGAVHFGEVDALARPHALREALGYLPQDFGFHPAVPVDETLSHFAALKGLVGRHERHAVVEALLARTNLLRVRRRPAGALSGGTRQRLGIAIALAGNPQLVILDEPTAGLDPAERHRIYDLLAELSADRVVVLSTHLVEDVRELCQAMAIMDQGRIVRQGHPGDLVAGLAGRVWERPAGTAGIPAPGPDGETPRVISVRRLAGQRVSRVLADAPPDARCRAVEPSLEDVYFLHVGTGEPDAP
jgi:ABC-type multidrug transport system ATPase subunit